jgi:hypothetical protein
MANANGDRAASWERFEQLASDLYSDKLGATYIDGFAKLPHHGRRAAPPTPTLRQLITSLKRWAKERGMNIDQLIHHLGVSRTALHYWETGERYPDKDHRAVIREKTGGAIDIPPPLPPRRRR